MRIEKKNITKRNGEWNAMKKRSKFGKYFKTLILSSALVCTAAQTAFAGELVTPTPSEPTDVVVVPDNVKTPPSVEGIDFWCENGVVKIPVTLGDYAAGDLAATMTVIMDGTNQSFEATLEDNIAIFSVTDLKEGEYAVEIEFYKKQDGNWISGSGGRTLTVPAEQDSQKWKAEQKTAKFDGSQDITFSFTNGTGSYALQSISEVEFFAWQQLLAGDKYYHNISVGKDHFTYDMETGTLTLNKDDIKYGIKESAKVWVQAGEDLKDYPQTGDITINVTALTSAGESVDLSSIEVYDPEYGVYGDSAWKIDITDYDLKLEDLGDKKTEFNVGSDQISVSEESGSVIEKNALAHIKEEYAEEFGKLGDNYTVSSKLNLTAQEVSAVEQEVKDGFQAGLGNREIIGQYYDINILANVLQNGQKVPGLENISIGKLDQKITINLQIPEAIRKSGRTYKVFHYNNETKKSEVLKSEVQDWVISFETDSFSPYALAYSDRTTSSGTSRPSFSDKNDNQGNQGNQGDISGNQPGNDNQTGGQNNPSKDQGSQNDSNGKTVTSPKTGDAVNAVLFIVMILMSAMLMAICAKRRELF